MTKYLTYKQAMSYLNIKSRITLNKFIDDGLPAIQIGGYKRIDKDAIDKYLASKTIKEG